MDKIAILKALKSQQQIEQAEKKIEVLESQCARSKQQEQVYYDEVLVYHKKTAKLEQHLNMANKKLEKLQVLSQEAEKQNKIRRNKYFEACKKVSSLEAKNLCLANREAYQDKQIESANQSAKQMEKETCSLLKKVADLERSRDLLDKKRREALAQVYDLQAKNTELEESVQMINSRNCYGNGEALRGRYLGEPQSAEELTECDRLETKLDILKREKKANLAKLDGAERDVLESERLNSQLREQVADLKQSLTERDHQVKQCKKLHESSRRHLQNEIFKLEETVVHWQEKYEQSVMELEKETTKGENGREGHEACWECELHLRACQSEVSERDMTIAYLETINNSHEDKIRQIIYQYQQTSSNVAKNERDILSAPELHHQLQILLSFYKKRSENATLELSKWKELAVEARSCRENESALFESQLSSISKDYYAKYESCRTSLEKEKSVRISLEGQVHGLIGELQECESKYKPYRRQLNELRQRYDSLLTESNNITGALHVTQPTSRQGCPQQLGSLMDDSADKRVLMDDDTERLESGMKHENTVCDAAQPGIEIGDCVVDGETVVGNSEIPVDTQHHMEALQHAIVNGSSSNENREVFADDESLNMEVENLRRKNNELQALCEKLTKEHDESLQTIIDSGQQSSDMAVKCERFENEIQKLKQELGESTSRTTELEKVNLEYKEENLKLKELVEELNARIAALESDNQAGNQVVESAMANTTMSAEVAQPSKDQKQEVEDALDEEFAAQELESTPEIPDKPESTPEIPDKLESTPEIPDNLPEDKTAVVEPDGEKAETKDETPLTTPETLVETPLSPPETPVETPLSPPETPLSPPEKAHGHVGSLARTAAMPFKRHTGVTHTTPSTARQRTRSVDHTTNSERRESINSEGDNMPAVADGKPKFLQKKLSMSHLDAFKPKPFKKQASLSDDISMYARPRRSSKTESTGSASDSDQSRETTEKLENHSEQSEPTQVHPDDSTDSAFTGDSPHPHKTTKEPPKPLPKPHRPTPTDKASASFSSGFSRKEYYSGIRPSGDGPEAEGGATTPPAAVESNEATNEQSKDELVGDFEQGDLV